MVKKMMTVDSNNKLDKISGLSNENYYVEEMPEPEVEAFDFDDIEVLDTNNEISKNDFFETVGATVAKEAISAVEGVLVAGESVVDSTVTGAQIVSGILYDSLQAVGGVITGNKWHSVTKESLENLNNNPDVVKNAFDNFYENNKVGKWIDDNSITGSKSIGKVIGEAVASAAVGKNVIPVDSLSKVIDEKNK